MPTYTFTCTNKKCGHVVESYQSIVNYKALKKCPLCKKNKLERDLLADLPNGSVVKGDSELTIGELAKRNNKRFSADHKEHLHNKNYAYRENPPPFKESKTTRKIREMREFASGLGSKAIKPKKK